ncbi:MAG: CopM family metallochaperone [Bosea sp. (in: a-proteobacteria)]
MNLKPIIAAFSIAAVLGGYALAQGSGHHAPGHQGHGSSHSGGHAGHGAGHGAAAKQADASPSSAAFRAANDKMHKGMDITFSGDADADFVRGMIPHHQGAVDMARIVLAFGKDAELRKLAQEIVAAQEKEIAFMQEWLKKSGK